MDTVPECLEKKGDLFSDLLGLNGSQPTPKHSGNYKWHWLCLIQPKNDMGHFKSFALGLFTAYGVYYITRKGPDGRSILDELLADPGRFMRAAKDTVVRDTVHAIKEEIS